MIYTYIYVGVLQIKEDERVLVTERGLLIRWVQRSDAGLYMCTAQEHSFTRTLLHLSLRVLERNHLPGHHSASIGPPDHAIQDMTSELRHSYKDYVRALSAPSLEEYCEVLWHKEKKQRQKAKWKHTQELRKSRNRRHHQGAAVWMNGCQKSK